MPVPNTTVLATGMGRATAVRLSDQWRRVIEMAGEQGLAAERVQSPVPAGQQRRIVARSWSTLRSRVPFVVLLVLVAFLVRATVAVAVEPVFFSIGYSGFTGKDDVAYDRVAWQQAQSWLGQGPPVAASDRRYLHAYTYMGAAVYVVAGHRPLAVKLLNCLLAALAVGLVYLCARKLFGVAAARFSGVAAAFFPSTVFWSVLNLKDPLFLFLMALTLWLLTLLLVTQHLRFFLAILVTLLLIGSVRAEVLLLPCLLIPGAFAVQQSADRWRKWAKVGILVAGCGAVFWYSGGVTFVRAYTNLARLDRQRFAAAGAGQGAFAVATRRAPAPTQVAASGIGASSASQRSPVPSSASRVVARVTAAVTQRVVVRPTRSPDVAAHNRATPTGNNQARTGVDKPVVQYAHPLRRLIAWLPTGIIFTLGAPFPWTADRAIEQLTIPDMLLWYVALALALVGALAHLRQWRRFVHIGGYVVGMVLIFAVAQGNVGTLIRQRAMMIVPFVVIFSGAGAAWLWSRWQARRETLRHTPLRR